LNEYYDCVVFSKSSSMINYSPSHNPINHS